MLANSLCLLLNSKASERDLERATHIFSDTRFTLDGQLYCVEHVGRDAQNRLMVQAIKEDNMAGELIDDILVEQAFNGVEERRDEDLLTVREVARRLRVDETTVRRWIVGGNLDAITLPSSGAYKKYRIRRATLDAILKGNQI